MRKRIVLALAVLCLTALAGCAKDKPGGEQNPEGAPVVENDLVSEDYRQGNASANLDGYFMRTEQGYYYYSKSRQGFRYYDITTGKDMFLCNKPECKHDGNAFCVATNGNYTVLNACIYSNRMYVYAMDETETQYRLKVLSLKLDGSEMSEVATVLTMEKTGQELVFDGENFCIHRNKIMIALNVKGKDRQEESEFYGAAILDLNTKKVVYLDENPVANENLETKEVHAYGDYFYYYKRVKKKNELHRYNIVTGTDEIHKFPVGFSGMYAVLGDNTVAYLKTRGSAMCFYHYDTGETIECTDFSHDSFEVDKNGELQWKEADIIPESMNGDGTYVYAIDHGYYAGDDNEAGVEKWWKESIVIAYAEDGKKVVAINVAAALDEATPEGVDLTALHLGRYLRFLDEDIYAEVPEESNWERRHVFKCKRSDFLAGTPKFEYVFVME